MTYTVSVPVALSREQLLEKLDDPENMKLWQPTFKYYEQLDDDPKAVGARMRLIAPYCCPESTGPSAPYRYHR